MGETIQEGVEEARKAAGTQTDLIAAWLTIVFDTTMATMTGELKTPVGHSPDESLDSGGGHGGGGHH
jgi:hypothetical protein